MAGGFLHFLELHVQKSIYHGLCYFYPEDDDLLKDRYKLDPLLLAQKVLKQWQWVIGEHEKNSKYSVLLISVYLSIFITSIYVNVLIFNMKSLAWQQSALSISEQKILFSCKSSKEGTQSLVDAE